MSTAQPLPAGDAGYVGLGLIANPFDLSHTALDPETDPLGVQFEVHAAVLAAMAAIQRSSESGGNRPLWIERDPTVSHYYHISALSELMETLTSAKLGVLPIHISLNEMRMGRIRSALNSLAYYVAGPRFAEILGHWMQEALLSPDEQLLADRPAAAAAMTEHMAQLTEDPEAAAEMLFGAPVFEREDTDVDTYVRESGLRQSMLETDPSEDDASTESDEGVAFTVLGPGEGDEIGPAEGDKPARWEDEVAEYVVAYARAHLSPVIARAIKAYAQDGTGPATEELKITKAPKKTLKALLRFARHPYRKVVFVYDQFDLWPRIPADLRSGMLGALSEMRWAVEESGLIVIVGDPKEAPEVREQFAMAETVLWSMPNIDAAFRGRDELQADLVKAWLGAGEIAENAPSLEDAHLQRLLEAAEDSLSRFAAAARVAIDDAAARDAGSIDDTAFATAMESL